MHFSELAGDLNTLNSHLRKTCLTLVGLCMCLNVLTYQGVIKNKTIYLCSLEFFLYAELSELLSKYFFFSVHVEDIILHMFQYIQKLRIEGPQEWVFQECKVQ